jgi:hypothetical protein
LIKLRREFIYSKLKRLLAANPLAVMQTIRKGCEKCGGKVKIIASIEVQAAIDKNLYHLQAMGILDIMF